MEHCHVVAVTWPALVSVGFSAFLFLSYLAVVYLGYRVGRWIGRGD